MSADVYKLRHQGLLFPKVVADLDRRLIMMPRSLNTGKLTHEDFDCSKPVTLEADDVIAFDVSITQIYWNSDTLVFEFDEA